MGIVWYYRTVESTLKVKPEYVSGHSIIACHKTNAQTFKSGCTDYYLWADVWPDGIVRVNADTKDEHHHMEAMLHDLAELATCGKLVVLKAQEYLEYPPSCYVVTPGKVEHKDCMCVPSDRPTNECGRRW